MKQLKRAGAMLLCLILSVFMFLPAGVHAEGSAADQEDQRHGQKAQHQVNKELVQLVAGGLLFHDFHMYASPLRIPGAPAW